jgi:hypothetical protein
MPEERRRVYEWIINKCSLISESSNRLGGIIIIIA